MNKTNKQWVEQKPREMGPQLTTPKSQKGHVKSCKSPLAYFALIKRSKSGSFTLVTNAVTSVRRITSQAMQNMD